jgi:hypothetical protein
MLRKKPKPAKSKRKKPNLESLIKKLKDQSAHNKSLDNEDSGDIVLVMLDDDDDEQNVDKDLLIKFDPFQIQDPNLIQLLNDNSDSKTSPDEPDEMISFIELYGLTNINSKTPTFIGKCPISLNSNRNSNSFIKVKCSTLISGKISLLLIRLIIKIKFNSKCNKRKMGNNSSSNNKKIKIVVSPSSGSSQQQQLEIRKSKRIPMNDSLVAEKPASAKQPASHQALVIIKIFILINTNRIKFEIVLKFSFFFKSIFF